jgi:hypothetical protein
MTILGSPESRQMARHLLERELDGVTDEAAVGAAMQRAYGRVSENLSRSVGEDGYAALLARALTRAQPEQPVWNHIRRVDAGRIHLDVAAGVSGNGAKAVDQALESLFAALVDILSDLIGADMVRNLLDLDEPRPRTQDNGRRP